MSIERIKAELATLRAIAPHDSLTIERMLESGVFPSVKKLLDEDAATRQNREAAASFVNGGENVV